MTRELEEAERERRIKDVEGMILYNFLILF